MPSPLLSAQHSPSYLVPGLLFSGPANLDNPFCQVQASFHAGDWGPSRSGAGHLGMLQGTRLLSPGVSVLYFLTL